ncbi:MAG: glycosyltransferase, partial [Candidatus Erginobacter occultus]|nr:glycosyltransferase [Candidatus Erginobacter occultus]
MVNPAPEISVLMPAFNEGRHIFANIRETSLAVAKLSDNFELVVVDDGSTDNTGEEIARAGREIPGVKTL